MHFGLFHLMQKREPALTSAEVYGDLVDRVRLAEDIGMTHSWIAVFKGPESTRHRLGGPQRCAFRGPPVYVEEEFPF